MASGTGSGAEAEGGLGLQDRHSPAQAPCGRGAPALTSAEPDSEPLKAVAALLQESLVEAWPGRASRREQSQDIKKEQEGCHGEHSMAYTNPGPHGPRGPPHASEQRGHLGAGQSITATQHPQAQQVRASAMGKGSQASARALARGCGVSPSPL